MLKDLPLQCVNDSLYVHCILQFEIPVEKTETYYFYPGFPLKITCYRKGRAMAETISFRYLIPKATF